MPASGPAPKEPSERRRNNVPTRGEWIDIHEPVLSEPVLPEKPPFKRGRSSFGIRAQKRWKRWRLDPVTTYWTEGDIDFALETLWLIDEEGVTIKTAPELRQRLTLLGLNPAGKRNLRFRITFGIGKEATKETKLPDNVVSMDERLKGLKHGG